MWARDEAAMGKRLMWVLWPAFLAAGAGEMLLFAFIDPTDLHIHGAPVALSRDAVYTLVFFALWLLMSLSSAMTVFLAASPFEINRCPLPRSDRPSVCPK
jgi:hypothetical protein